MTDSTDSEVQVERRHPEGRQPALFQGRMRVRTPGAVQAGQRDIAPYLEQFRAVP